MASTVQRLTQRGLITPPGFLPSNVHYETMMGSIAYGVSTDASDVDVYGFCIPPKDMIFPHLRGEILGFGRQKKRFEQYQQHHIDDDEAGKQYDVTIYSIVKYFHLCMDNNPNMIDSLFTPQRCVLHCTKVGNMVREQRRLFLHKGSWHKFKGYAYSQLHKMATKDPEPGSKRAKLREQYGFDVKFAYHVVRLLDEAEQILVEGDIDLQRNREQLKAIRRGEMSEEEVRAWASDKERQLERLYAESPLPHSPNEDKIKALLMQCLEEHYGDLSWVTGHGLQDLSALVALREIRDVVARVQSLLDG
jgi:predicted nucleotidyltransferase